jgi:uncharacterized membrane protein YgcG
LPLAKRVVSFVTVCLRPALLSTSHQNQQKALPHFSQTFFLSLALDSTQFVFLYVMGFVCVCVCVLSCVCVCFSFSMFGFFFYFFCYFFGTQLNGNRLVDSRVRGNLGGGGGQIEQKPTERDSLDIYVRERGRHENREVPHREMSSTSNIYV